MNEQTLQVSVADLKRIFDLFCQQLQKRGIETLEIDQDYYWHIPIETRYDPYQAPQNLDLGQLSDDLTGLMVLIKENRQAFDIDWEHFAAVVAAVAADFPR